MIKSLQIYSLIYLKKYVTLMLLALIPCALLAQKLAIVPQPVSLENTTGNFIMDGNTILKYNKEDQDLQAAASFFTSTIKYIGGINLLRNINSQKVVELKFEKI